ncbi:tetrathionate reductase family octaheme c-type cytochrome [Oricola thermophila]|uniref:Tetrathionate reductase family octaheme c-type cytochrome n=1 Tax=Oricola thermophila TaxID=2742145 RepID=A0A6N1V7T4_9HYPH|nr:tetrathionate reductase family octaheme c-type cytochrome [Oricola thermophila]QKV17016.1 tetrathionate reductase family octaheme c-type cytochrome [Oricola thermophila]
MRSGRVGPSLVVALFLTDAAPVMAQVQSDGKSGSTADHSEFGILKKPFASGPEVTEACLACHTEAAEQVQESIHWTWDYTHPTTGQKLGKSRVINAFCGNLVSNEPRCTSCHAGYGWDGSMDGPPKAETAVDCLVCHDKSGTYTKLDNAAGHPPLTPVPANAKTITGAPAKPVDLNLAAQSVGLPDRDNCGQCHFYGGGGDNVKHGDLSSALYDPDRSVDVHMSKDGANMVCTDCHVTNSHVWAGSRYNVAAHDMVGTGKPGERRDVATCESCHGTAPHKAASLKGLKLNDHIDRVACQTCHIPEFAKGGVATKTFWDWSTAGDLKDGKPYGEEEFVQSDGKRLHTYLSTKGDFEWEENVVPHYAWFDGQVEYTTIDRKIDPTKVVEVNSISGSPDDGKSRIWPFKRMEGRQAYDSKLNNLVYTNVYGPETDTAFWTNFDWSKAIEAAMEKADLPYSGEFGFVDTYMYWPITHMVAPSENALDCEACHAEDGRLARLAGFYMPGRDPGGTVDRIGLAILLAAIAGVFGHAILRLVLRMGGRS